MAFVLDAYAARSCPLRTVHAFTPGLTPPLAERPVPPFFRDAGAIEAEVLARILRGEGVVDLRPLADGPADTAVAACLEALASGAEVIVGGRLPRDRAGHRTGRPTFLVRTRGDEFGYHPVQVKYHRVFESTSEDAAPQVVSSLTTPRAPVAVAGRGFRWTTRLNAALQLAHYWRLLEAAGFAAEHPWAGVVGTDRIELPGRAAEPVIAWLDLGAARVPPDPGSVEAPSRAAPVSTLERYDRALAYRVELASAAMAGSPPALVPPITGECRGCVWLPHCTGLLDPDDVSLRLQKSPLDAHEIAVLRGMGISTVHDLAGADVDALLEHYLPRASHRDGAEPRIRRAYRRAAMMAAGRELDRVSAEPIDLPRHDLEIDIDIETSSDDRVYLWGFLVDDPERGRPTYHHVSTFADLDDTDEAELAALAFAWLRDLTDGRDAALYHYSDYEVLRANRLAARIEDTELADWARAATTSTFVDLFEVVRTHFLGANGLGLKVVAHAVSGFDWRDPDPGGLNSQRWFDDAVHLADADARSDARTRVLEYNEDDVRATWHLRRWLRRQT